MSIFNFGLEELLSKTCQLKISIDKNTFSTRPNSHSEKVQSGIFKSSFEKNNLVEPQSANFLKPITITPSKCQNIFIREESKDASLSVNRSRESKSGSQRIDTEENKKPNSIQVISDDTKLDPEEKLRRFELMLSSVVHEFRTPINAFSNVTTLLELNLSTLRAIFKGLKIKDEGMLKDMDHIWKSSSKYFKTCHISSTMMTKLTDDILDLSKINNGVFELNEHPFEIEQLVEEITYVFEYQCQQKGIDFEFLCDEYTRQQIFCSDINRIKQVLLNLISNSFKFTCEGSISVSLSIGSNSLTVKGASRTLYISVKDTGAGIAEEEATHLFSIFGRYNSSKNKKVNCKGTGLGLAISKQLVNKMGGDIMLESEPN